MINVFKDKLPYRSCVGAMLIDAVGRVFVAKRIDSPGDAWQMPQGGIDEGEDPAKAVMRELQEETGTDKAEIIAESDRWRAYDLPDELIGRLWGGKYRGQRQKWFALKFLGEDNDIDIEAHETPEFSDWKWVEIDEVVSLIVPFKRALYGDIVSEFRRLVSS
jgi:putative (di)nucleoside polyphosphate hydrolase